MIKKELQVIGKLNHVAVAVDDIYAAIDNYRSKLGATVRGPVDEIEHGVSVAFVDLPNSKVELISPLGNDSPIKKFLAKNCWPNKNLANVFWPPGWGQNLCRFFSCFFWTAIAPPPGYSNLNKLKLKTIKIKNN